MAKKIPKHWRIHPHYLERMTRLLLPHQTETDFVEDALYDKILKEEAEKGRAPASSGT